MLYITSFLEYQKNGEKKHKMKKECRKIVGKIHSLRHDRADKNRQYFDTENAMKKIQERIESFDNDALVNEYKNIVSIEYNPNIKIINNKTGLQLPFLSSVLNLDSLPKQLGNLQFETPEQVYPTEENEA